MNRLHVFFIISILLSAISLFYIAHENDQCVIDPPSYFTVMDDSLGDDNRIYFDFVCVHGHGQKQNAQYSVKIRYSKSIDKAINIDLYINNEKVESFEYGKHTSSYIILDKGINQIDTYVSGGSGVHTEISIGIKKMEKNDTTSPLDIEYEILDIEVIDGFENHIAIEKGISVETLENVNGSFKSKKQLPLGKYLLEEKVIEK